MADSLFGIHAAALELRSQRMGLIASNIANAATPGYKARDIDFATALKARMAGASNDQAVNGATRYRVPVMPSLDGNTVEMADRTGRLQRKRGGLFGHAVVHPRARRNDHPRAEGRMTMAEQPLTLFRSHRRAMSAQLVRMNAAASNLANAGTVSGTEAGAYRPLRPVFAEQLDRPAACRVWACSAVVRDGTRHSPAQSRPSARRRERRCLDRPGR
jgi:flagellar basal-body rod protein FlgB